MRKDRHHRLPKIHGGRRNKKNMVKVPMDLHHWFHKIFSRHNGEAMSVEEIAHELNTVWCDPNSLFVIVKRNNRAYDTQLGGA
jgi:hypothetical protein